MKHKEYQLIGLQVPKKENHKYSINMATKFLFIAFACSFISIY